LRPEKISFGPGGALSRFSPARSGTRKK
jgi:hypothetical protein